MGTDGIVADGRCQKVRRNQFGPLMNQLIKCVLAVGSRLAPDNGAGLIGHPAAVAIRGFAVAFHIALLEVSRKPVHILIVGQYGFRCGAEKIIVPDSDQG